MPSKKPVRISSTPRIPAPTIAEMTVRGLDKMDDETKKRVANWLRSQARCVVKAQPDQYSSTYKARLHAELT